MELSSHVAGDVLAISIPRTETYVIRHFQERMPYGLFVPEVACKTGVLSWARMISAPHSTIDIAEAARDIERAAEIFAHSEGATFPPEAISNLRLAVVLLLAIVPHSTRHDAECAVIAEFMTRAEGKLGHVRDAAGLLRAARTKLVRELLIKN